MALAVRAILDPVMAAAGLGGSRVISVLGMLVHALETMLVGRARRGEPAAIVAGPEGPRLAQLRRA